MKILIIGCGNMGLTYAKSFLRSHITDEKDMMILEKSDEKIQQLTDENIGSIFKSPEGCIPLADLIILAVKPQDSSVLFQSIRPYLDAQQVVLSIMAGITTESIMQQLDIAKVIRAMPNLPAQVGMGMTAFTSSPQVTRIELVMVQNLLNTTGKAVYVEKEELLDAATAISGSGPAYVWFFMGALIKAARNMGFSESEAELLVYQTFHGAVDLYNKTDSSCEEWIQRVCSRGGTTEAALEVFQNSNLHEDIVSGAFAALHRAIALGKPVI